jgi:hypothetical protein
MLTEQLRVGITEAFVRLRAYDDIVGDPQYGRQEQASLIRHDPGSAAAATEPRG